MQNRNRSLEGFRSFLERPGIVFMLSVWMQSQMIDLLILKRHPEIRAEFLNSNANHPIPKLMVKGRARFTTRSFEDLVDEFTESFQDLLSSSCSRDLKETAYFRNAIAHAQINTGRASGDFLLFFPRREAKMKELTEFFGLVRPENPSDPPMLVLDFDEERYGAHWDRCVRLEECFRAIAMNMDIPYEKIC